MSLTIPFSEACERNKDPIFELIEPILKSVDSVLEIGSGTGQHAIYFAQQVPHLKCQTSDQEIYLEGIRAQLQNAELQNVLLPIEIDVTQERWLPTGAMKYDVVYSANTLHIMSWAQVQDFFRGLSEVLNSNSNGKLIVYGPFKYQGQFTSPSNAQFDQSLKQRDPLSGIRDFEAVNELAEQQGFSLQADYALPANNQCLVWKKA